MFEAFVEKCDTLKSSYFKWRAETLTVYKIFLSLTMASVTGLAAQVRLPLPFTPVPITGQTLAALLSGVLLGGGYGGLSQLFYVAMGVSGIPWFTGWSSGFSHLAGPTGGYIIGFIVAALFIGHITDNSKKPPGFILYLCYMLVANFILIYGIGLIQLYLWFQFVANAPVGIVELVNMGMLPFIPGDITKAMAAAAIAKRLRS